MTKFLTAKQVAERYGVNSHTVRAWATNGRLGYIQLGGVGGAYRFTPEQLEEFEEKNERRPKK